MNMCIYTFDEYRDIQKHTNQRFCDTGKDTQKGTVTLEFDSHGSFLAY